MNDEALLGNRPTDSGTAPLSVDEQVRTIKKHLRGYMNGVASASMRDKGLDYRLNFGVDVIRLQALAREYQPSTPLAQALWKQEVRECKIMATMLQPPSEFDADMADLWMEQTHTVEMVQYTVMHLLQYVPYASQKAFQWMASDNELLQTAGFTLIGRLFMNGQLLNERAENEFIDQARVAIHSGNTYLIKAAQTAVVKYENIKNSDILSEIV